MRKSISVALCVAKGGAFNLDDVRRYIDQCTCRHRHQKYTVICREILLETPRAGGTDAVTKRVVECARKALEIDANAELGVGLEKGTFLAAQGSVSMFVPIAAAALVFRDEKIPPKVILITPAEGRKDVAKELLGLCQQQGFHRHQGERPLMENVVESLRTG